MNKTDDRQKSFDCIGDYSPPDAERLLQALTDAQINFEIECDDGTHQGTVVGHFGHDAKIRVFAECGQISKVQKIQEALLYVPNDDESSPEPDSERPPYFCILAVGAPIIGLLLFGMTSGGRTAQGGNPGLGAAFQAAGIMVLSFAAGFVFSIISLRRREQRRTVAWVAFGLYFFPVLLLLMLLLSSLLSSVFSSLFH